MYLLKSGVKSSCELSNSKSLNDSSEACLIIVIFRLRGTGGVEGCEAFILNFEPCLSKSFSIFSESSEISDKFALGASGLETGLLFLFWFPLGLRNFSKSFLGFVGEHNESSGDANFVVEFLLKMPEMVCIKVFLLLFSFVLFDFWGEEGNESFSLDTIPSSFSISFNADEDFFISCFFAFRATGIPNLAGSGIKRETNEVPTFEKIMKLICGEKFVKLF